MHLIQQRQIAGTLPGPTLRGELSKLRNDLLSGTNESYDILNSDVIFKGRKSFEGEITFDSKVYMTKLPLSLYVSGGMLLEAGNNFSFGNSSLYMSAPNYYNLIFNSSPGGGSGLLTFNAESGIVLASSTVDVSDQSTNLRISDSSYSALTVSPGVGGPAIFTVDTASDPARFGFNNTVPGATVDITGTQNINANNTSANVMMLRNTGGSQTYLAIHSEAGTSRVGTYDKTIDPLSGFYVKAADPLPLYLGHDSASAIRIDYLPTHSRVRMGEWYGEGRPLDSAGSVVEIQNTGLAGPVLALINDASSDSQASAAVRFVDIHSASSSTGSWILGCHYGGGDGSFRLAHKPSFDNATLGTNNYLTVSTSGALTISGVEQSSLDSTAGGNLNVSGNISLTTGLLFYGYDDMPAGDPAIKGVVYRDGGTLKISAG